MKIKWWPNTTGEISNILFEDIYLGNASVAIQMMANYGGAFLARGVLLTLLLTLLACCLLAVTGWACPCPWIHPFGGPGQVGKCKTYPPPFSVGVGGNCGPEGDETTNVSPLMADD